MAFYRLINRDKLGKSYARAYPNDDDVYNFSAVMAEVSGRLPFRLFFGWFVLASTFIILFFNMGARMSIGVIFKPMMAEFGWGRSSVSLAFFLNMTLFALSLTVAGRFYDRYGPKWLIIVSTVITSVGFISIAFVNSYGQYLICYGVITPIGLGGTSVPLVAALISKWFEKRRGLAISLALSGASIGQFVLVPLITVLVLNHGWRPTYFGFGLTMLVVNIALVLLVIKGDPADLGLSPFGHAKINDPAEPADYKPPNSNPGDMGLKEAMRTYSFWFFVVVMFICGSGDFLVTTHLIPFVTDKGVSPITAGNMLAWLGLMSLPGMLVAGPASDRIGNKTPIALAFAIRVLVFILIIRYQSTASFYLFALVFGFTLLITAPLTATLAGKLYGFSHVGVLAGFITTIHHLGGGFWAYLGGATFDATQSYDTIFIYSAIAAGVSFVFTLLIKEKRHHHGAV